MGERVRLGDVILPSSQRNKNGECTRVYSVTNSNGFVPSEEYFNKEVYSKELDTYRVVNRGMLAYNPSRINVGSVALQDKEDQVVVSPLYVVFSVDERRIAPEYLLRFLKCDEGLKQIETHSVGTVRNNLKYKGLCNLRINLPSLKAQHSMVRKLRVIETLIDNSQSCISMLDQLVKSQFVEMFENGDWRQARLSDCCCSPDDIKCGPFGSQLHKEDYRAGGVPVWGIPEVNSAFRSMPQKYVCVEDADRLNAYSLMGGDIALSRKGNVGNAALFDGSMPNGIIHSDVLRIRVDREKLDPLFLVHQFHTSHFVLNQIMSVSAGAIMAGTNVTKLKRIKVTVPPLPLSSPRSTNRGLLLASQRNL